MSDEPTIEIVSEPGTRHQFGKGRLSYQNTAGKFTAPVAVSSCLGLAAAVSCAIWLGRPQKNHSDKISRFLGVEVPQSTPEVGTLMIHSVGSHPTPNSTPPKGSRSGKAALRLSGPQLLNRPRSISIPPGSMGEAILISGASDGPVKAQLKGPLIVAGETLLEAGTVLMGTGQSGEDRLLIHFRKAVFSDGTSAPIEAQAADTSDKMPGLLGSRVGYRALKLAAGVGLNFAGGLSQGLQTTQGQFGAVVTPPSMKNALLNGAERSAIEEGQQMMNEYRSEKAVLTVSAGTIIWVLFDDPS